MQYQSPIRNWKSVLKGFARGQEILAIYSGNNLTAKREKNQNGYPIVKGRNKIVHSKSISSSVGEINPKNEKPEVYEYDYSAYDPKLAEDMQNKR